MTDFITPKKVYNCTDCDRLIHPDNLFGHGVDNVCAYCYAIRVQHPSARMKVGR